MLPNLFVLQQNCKKKPLSHRSCDLSSINNTKYRVIPSYLNKFINHLMVDGKKGTAVEVFADSLRLFLRKLQEGKESPLEPYSKNQTFLLDGRYRVPAFAPRLTDCSPVSAHVRKKPARASPQVRSLCIKEREISSPHKIFQKSKKTSTEGSLSPSIFNGIHGDPSLLIKDEHQMGNTSKSALQPYFDSIKCPFFLQRPGANLLGLAFSSPRQPLGKRTDIFQDIRSSISIIYYPTNACDTRQATASGCEPSSLEERQGVRSPPLAIEGVREKRIFLGKQHHFSESNSPLPSLISCLEQALINVEPSLEVRKKKIAGITRQIPSILSKSRGQGLAIRWIIDSARGRRRKEGKRFSECLAEELVSAYHKKGEPRQKRDALHKLAESNRSFLRYRWW